MTSAKALPLIVVACADAQTGVMLISSFAKDGFFTVLASTKDDLERAIVQNSGDKVVIYDESMSLALAYKLLEARRSLPRSLQVYILGSCADEDTEVSLLEAGARDYLHKPIRIRALLARVRKEALPVLPRPVQHG